MERLQAFAVPRKFKSPGRTYVPSRLSTNSRPFRFRGFEFDYGLLNPSAVTVGPQCFSTVTEGNFQYWECGMDGKDQFREVAVGTTKVTSTIPWTSTRIETFEVGGPTESGPAWNTTTIIIPLLSTTTKQAWSAAITTAPAVQLVWRPSDLSRFQTSGSSTATSPTSAEILPSSQGAPLPTGGIVGITVGAIVAALCLAFAIFWYLRARRRKGDRKSPETADHNNIINLAEPGDEPQSPFIGKAELDATYSTIWTDGPGMGKQELPAVSVSPPLLRGVQEQRFELDATPAAPEPAPEKQPSGSSADQTTVHGSTLGPSRPVSALSDQLTQRSHTVSPPSTLSGAGAKNGYTAEGWRASIIEE